MRYIRHLAAVAVLGFMSMSACGETFLKPELSFYGRVFEKFDAFGVDGARVIWSGIFRPHEYEKFDIKDVYPFAELDETAHVSVWSKLQSGQALLAEAGYSDWIVLQPLKSEDLIPFVQWYQGHYNLQAVQGIAKKEEQNGYVWTFSKRDDPDLGSTTGAFEANLWAQLLRTSGGVRILKDLDFVEDPKLQDMLDVLLARSDTSQEGSYALWKGMVEAKHPDLFPKLGVVTKTEYRHDLFAKFVPENHFEPHSIVDWSPEDDVKALLQVPLYVPL